MQQAQNFGLAALPLNGGIPKPAILAPMALGPNGEVISIPQPPAYVYNLNTNVAANTAPLIDFLNDITWPVEPGGQNYGGLKIFLASFSLEVCAVAAIAAPITLRLAKNVAAGTNTYFNKQFVAPVGTSFTYTRENYMRELPLAIPASSQGYQLGLVAAPGATNYAQLSATVFVYYDYTPFAA